jgi:Zn finger protein HypA/HybF involved in hydrogenase expression
VAIPVTSDHAYLVCPACEHCEAYEADGGDEPTCPACGSARAYCHHEPALPDAESEAYVKLDAETAKDR